MEDLTPSSDHWDLIGPSGILSTSLIKVVTYIKCPKYFYYSDFKDSNIFLPLGSGFGYYTLKQCQRTLVVLFNSGQIYKCDGEHESSISVSFEDVKIQSVWVALMTQAEVTLDIDRNCGNAMANGQMNEDRFNLH